MKSLIVKIPELVQSGKQWGVVIPMDPQPDPSTTEIKWNATNKRFLLTQELYYRGGPFTSPLGNISDDLYLKTKWWVICRWLSPLHLKINTIRVKRIDELTKNNILSAGVQRVKVSGQKLFRYSESVFSATTPLRALKNGLGIKPEQNPWVWMISFRRK